MSNEDPIEVRQENEIEALKAIYGEDLCDLRGKATWSLWKPLDICITLTPQQGSSGELEVYAKVDLHVICSKKYPNEPPQILLEKSRGLSISSLDELKSGLKLKCNELKGEEMIFELAQYTKSFLYKHNKPMFKSFYEEMVNGQKQRELQLRQAKQEEKDRERQVILHEIKQRQEILKSENKLRRERYSTENSDDSTNNRKNSSGYCENEITDCNHKGTQVIEFSNNGVREIQRGRCINHLLEGCVTYYSGLDIETGELFAIGEWSINLKTEDTQIHRQISSIEQELNYLIKLKHSNLCHYVNMKHFLSKQENKMVVYILQEFSVGLSCTSLLNDSFPVDTDLIRHISRGVLHALEFLHRNNVVHKNISHSCIFISSNGAVKVSNYSIYRRLSDLIYQCHSLNTYNKKTDIYNFGELILSLVCGGLISHDNADIPLSVPVDIHDFLTRCLAKDEKDRYTAAQLLQHPFIRTPIERQSPQRHISEIALPMPGSPEPCINDLKNLTQRNSNGQSRVESEFEVMQSIGKGAFGDVLKVKNKLDGGHYAIKRVELNPKNRQLNKKVIREVKLLSKLNHENVVRYYNAWIETAVIDIDDNNSLGKDLSDGPIIIQQKELTFKDDVELLAPPIKDVEWSISYESKSKPGTINESSSEDESNDEDEWGMLMMHSSSDSNSIEFKCEDSTTIDSEVSENPSVTNEPEKINSPFYTKEIQFLYIQMEFCEKSTLRTAIDADLYLDNDRIWRLFREIIEGLTHIHQQGMIHRDLKPVNIFLDLNDHVKIGDFGLATTNILSRPGEIGKIIQENDKEVWSSEMGDGSLTGQVGTALYTAPELNSTSKTNYNQKVDIYSLGIIFFEMCYKPLITQMEKMKILTGIRSREIIFPTDFSTKECQRQERIIRWLLNHDISKRPTSYELLQSDFLPPPLLEEEKLREMFRHTLNNPQSKAYKYLVASCFQQPVTPAQDITYDMNLTAPNLTKFLQLFHYVKATVTNIFNLHGGQNLSTPLLMPKSKYYDKVDSCVKLITHSGSIVAIPHDLRVSFARYVAWNNISLLRRYCIERVFREKKIFGFHPRELYECAFDIVTPNPGNFVYDAEILYIVNEIINSLFGSKNKNVIIRLNHTSIIKAILLHCGIKQHHNDILRVLSDAKEGKVSNLQIKTHLISLGLSDNAIGTLFHLIELEAPLQKIISTLQMITKKKSSEASVLAKQGLQELKHIIQNAETLGVSFNIVVAPGLVYHVPQYSGMLCQFVCELRKNRKSSALDVVAAGGRYDGIIASYRNIKEQANMLIKDVPQSAVGISISLDKLVLALQEENDLMVCDSGNLDTVVCSLGSKSLLKEKSKILKELWSAGFKCGFLEANNLEEIQEQCIELNVSHVILLKDTEQGTVRIRSWEKDRFQEKTVNCSDLVETMQKVMRQWNEGYQEQSQSVTNLRSDNKISCEHNHETAVSVLFVTTEKLPAYSRRRYENQIKSQLETTLKRLSGDVIIFGLNLEADIIRTLSSYLDFESENHYQKSLKQCIEKHQRQSKHIQDICEEIYEQKLKRSNPILILYSLSEYFYKLLL